VLVVIAMTVGAIVAAPYARSARPLDVPAPPAAGITEISLGQIDPAAALGSRLEVVEQRWAPAAFATQHVHPAALVTCVQEGALGFALQQGAATLTYGETATASRRAEPLARRTTVILRPGDCIAFDEFAVHTEHTAWNASDGPTVVWEVRLRDPHRPFTISVDPACLLAPRCPLAAGDASARATAASAPVPAAAERPYRRTVAIDSSP
jgi:hypothetical protein